MPVLNSPIAREILEKAPGLARMYERYTAQLDRLMAQGHLKPADLAGKRVLDWECGAGIFALLFLERGAGECEAIDSWLQLEDCQKAMGHIPNLRFEKVGIVDYAADASRHGSFDFIFANTVTEHMLDLPKQLPLIGRLLKPGGLFITNHDNYYQPVGSHDHGFLNYGDGPAIVRQGPACWDAPDKCAASAQHRAGVKEKLWWTWTDEMEKKLTPEDCTRCPYFKRSQPWAHLTCQGEFREIFPHVAFTTGFAKSSLNKVTPFQLKQFVIEAGFDIAGWQMNKIKNEPPPHLMAAPFNFSRDDLTTCTITVVARKAFCPYGE